MILDLLRHTPRTKRDLAEALGTSTREVELMIQQARLEGAPIVSDSDGYRLATSPQELRECADRLQRRVVSQYMTLRALRRTARRLEGVKQETLWRAA